MSTQFEELSETVTDTMENLERLSVFGRSGNTLENIMVYKTRIGLELSHLQGSDLEIMAYCHEEWKYFTKTYPNVEPEILPSIKYLLKYDECVTFFSKENIEKRRVKKELTDLRESCKTTGMCFQSGAILFYFHLVYSFFLIVTEYTFIGVIHLVLFGLWIALIFVGVGFDDLRSRRLFDQEKTKLGYAEDTPYPSDLSPELEKFKMELEKRMENQ